MEFFPTIDPDAIRNLTFDFSKKVLQPGEVLVGGPTVLVRCTAGADTNAEAILLAPPSYDNTGTMIVQPVGNLSALDGNDYAFEALSLTTFSPTKVVIRATLQVRSD